MAEKGTYTYDWPRPMVSVDAVVFSRAADRTEVLLINRGKEPFKGCWAVPGGFLELDEELEVGAARELAEETGVTGVQLEQIRAFGTCGRDPRGRMISIVFMGLADTEQRAAIKAGDDAAKAQWFDIKKLPENLAFDHDEMIKFAIDKSIEWWASPTLRDSAKREQYYE